MKKKDEKVRELEFFINELVQLRNIKSLIDEASYKGYELEAYQESSSWIKNRIIYQADYLIKLRGFKMLNSKEQRSLLKKLGISYVMSANK